MTEFTARLSVVKRPATMAVSHAVENLGATEVNMCNLGREEPDCTLRTQITEATLPSLWPN